MITWVLWDSSKEPAMELNCPQCGEIVRVDENGAENVHCSNCSAVIESPQQTGVTTSLPRRSMRTGDDEPRNDRPSARSAPQGGRFVLVLLILLVVGAPLLLVLSCMALSILAALATHDEMEVAVAAAP